MTCRPRYVCAWTRAVTAVPARPLAAQARCWRSAQINPTRCVIELDGQAYDELAAMDEAIRSNPLPVTLRHADQFHIRACDSS